MADYGFDFCVDETFVTHAAGNAAVRAATDASTADEYPTTFSNGIDGGWEDLGTGHPRGRDRDAGIDSRLASMAFCSAGIARNCRFDIPAGNYTVGLAQGDASNAQGDMYLYVKDDSTARITLTENSTASDTNWFDATDVERTSSADWASNNAVTASLSFASGIARVQLGDALSAGNSCIAHVKFFAVAAAGAFNPYYYRHLAGAA